MRRIPRRLEPEEVRVLGVLLEKEQTTPDVYPLTVKALVAGCNQRSNRDPVMELDEAAVRSALGSLIHDTLVWRTEGTRATKWRHNLDDRWELGPRRKALLTELLLRGPQTVGQLRSRCSRMVELEGVGEVEAVLERLALPPEPLVRELEREPGQKGTRWTHRLGPPEAAEAPRQSAAAVTAPSSPDAAGDGRLRELERRLRELEERVAELEASFPNA